MIRQYVFFVIILFIIVYLGSCDIIISNQSKPDVPPDHTVIVGGVFHKSGERGAVGCSDCHGRDLRGGVQVLDGRHIWAQSCYQCHGDLWH